MRSTGMCALLIHDDGKLAEFLVFHMARNKNKRMGGMGRHTTTVKLRTQLSSMQPKRMTEIERSLYYTHTHTDLLSMYMNGSNSSGTGLTPVIMFSRPS